MSDETVLFYSRLLTQAQAEEAVSPAAAHVVSAPASLAREIVSGRKLSALVVQLEALDEEFERLLRSVRRHFPLLPVVLMTDGRLPPDINGAYHRLPGYLEGEQLASALRAELETFSSRERRKYPRYDWPLIGDVLSDEEGRTFNIRSISAGGAFLEQRAGMPEAGTDVMLRVHFQGSSFTTQCHTLERRMASSNLPPGQGVRFNTLSEKGREIVDRVVRDALMEILLDPDSEPDVPTLDPDTMEMSLAPEFTLA